jgi:hypothetical protein
MTDSIWMYQQTRQTKDRKSVRVAIDELSKTRPMAAVRASVKLQANARTIERNAALFGNSHYKISWEKIGSLFGHTAQWAYKRYVELPRQAALSGAIRLAKPSKPEVKKEPDGQ